MSYNKKITLPILQYYDSKIKPYISNLISNHNSATNSHSDIRTKISNDEKKLNTIATGAEVNQNAFSTVNVTSGGSSTAVNAASKTASLGLTAGNNVTLGTSGSTVTVNSAQRNVTSSLTSTSDTTGLSASAGKNLQDQITTLNSNSFNNILHNIPRIVPKDITSYYTDGTLWKRLNGTNGFSLFEDIYAGDYFKMSRPISAYNQNQDYQATGSQYVTIAEIDPLYGNGDNITLNYHHLVMIPGQGFGGTQHFGRSRMNPTNTTEGGYIGSEMYTTTIGEVATSGSTATTATINQQLYAEFGSHLKTTRELLTNEINETGVNRFGEAGGCSSSYSWYSCQAVLMSEIEVYGSIVWSSSGRDTGNANKQFALFANKKQAINNNKSAYYWLKDIASASNFCNCFSGGFSNYRYAGDAGCYVRPRFVIAA